MPNCNDSTVPRVQLINILVIILLFVHRKGPSEGYEESFMIENPLTDLSESSVPHCTTAGGVQYAVSSKHKLNVQQTQKDNVIVEDVENSTEALNQPNLSGVK